MDKRLEGNRRRESWSGGEWERAKEEEEEEEEEEEDLCLSVYRLHGRWTSEHLALKHRVSAGIAAYTAPSWQGNSKDFYSKIFLHRIRGRSSSPQDKGYRALKTPKSLVTEKKMHGISGEGRCRLTGGMPPPGRRRLGKIVGWQSVCHHDENQSEDSNHN
eukprot:764800-Hanusia_phi.AAC.2